MTTRSNDGGQWREPKSAASVAARALFVEESPGVITLDRVAPAARELIQPLEVAGTGDNGVLLKYAPGDSLAGATFSRASIATYRDATGTLVSAASGVPRDGHYALNPVTGLYERALLLEAARTNLMSRSEDFSTWSANTTTRTGGQADPFGGTAAYLLEATGANAFLQRATTGPTLTAGTVYTVSCWLKRGPAGGTMRLAVFDGLTTYQSADITPTTEWVRYSHSFTLIAGATELRGYVGGASSFTTGEDVVAFGYQVEVGPFASSYVPTAAVGAARAADALTFPLPPTLTTPSEVTLYARFIEQGTLKVTTGRLMQFANSNPRLLLQGQGTAGYYTLTHINAAGAPVGSAAVAFPLTGDLVELRGILYADGSVQLGVSINGGAEVLGVRSAALALPVAWAQDFCYLGGTGGNIGFTEMYDALVARGVVSRDTLRALAA